MNSARQKKLLWVLYVLVGMSVVVALVLYALREQVDHYYAPAQIAQKMAPENKRIRAGGVVVAGSVQRDRRYPLKVMFSITDNVAVVKVQYEGILPDLFKEKSGVVATGYWTGNVFLADSILAKHDENYMPPEVAASLKPTRADATANP